MRNQVILPKKIYLYLFQMTISRLRPFLLPGSQASLLSSWKENWASVLWVAPLLAMAIKEGWVPGHFSLSSRGPELHEQHQCSYKMTSPPRHEDRWGA